MYMTKIRQLSNLEVIDNVDTECVPPNQESSDDDIQVHHTNFFCLHLVVLVQSNLLHLRPFINSIR